MTLKIFETDSKIKLSSPLSVWDTDSTLSNLSLSKFCPDTGLDLVNLTFDCFNINNTRSFILYLEQKIYSDNSIVTISYLSFNKPFKPKLTYQNIHERQP